MRKDTVNSKNRPAPLHHEGPSAANIRLFLRSDDTLSENALPKCILFISQVFDTASGIHLYTWL